MPRTIFTTPIVNGLFRWLSVVYLKLAGWQVLGTLPPEARRSVFIAAPHTSNWDLPYTLMVAAQHLLDGQGQHLPLSVWRLDALAGRHRGGSVQVQ